MTSPAIAPSIPREVPPTSAHRAGSGKPRNRAAIVFIPILWPTGNGQRHGSLHLDSLGLRKLRYLRRRPNLLTAAHIDRHLALPRPDAGPGGHGAMPHPHWEARNGIAPPRTPPLPSF